MNAILYSLVSGCQWRMLPKDFPPYNTVYYYFRKWKYEGTFELAMFELHQIVCVNILGLPLAIAIHAANIHDSVGAEMVFKEMIDKFPRLKAILADGGYRGESVSNAAKKTRLGAESRS